MKGEAGAGAVGDVVADDVVLVEASKAYMFKAQSPPQFCAELPSQGKLHMSAVSSELPVVMKLPQ